MSNSPAKVKKHKIKGLNDLINNNNFVLVLSLFIAFLVWLAVAMYASPEESYTIYNIPITINTENSLVAQKGYKNFWQSDEALDVTVTGPRYLITTLTPDDIIVSANLNTVDSAGVSKLSLKVNLRQESQDITISQQSKTEIEIYFDTELEKDIQIYLDKDIFEEKVAEGFLLNSTELPVTTVKVKGPETEVNKIVRVVADPQLPEDLLFASSTLPLTLSLEGNNATDTVNANKYVRIVDEQEFFVKVNIDRLAALIPTVDFIGEATGEVTVSFTPEAVDATIDTASEFGGEELPVMTVDYEKLNEGNNTFIVNSANIELPEGVKLSEEEFVFTATITLTK